MLTEEELEHIGELLKEAFAAAEKEGYKIASAILVEDIDEDGTLIGKELLDSDTPKNLN